LEECIVNKAEKRPVIHVMSYTHWDREFRFDFETTRAWLVRLMDRLVDLLESDSAYRHFMLDGQFILVDDYLEIRPEMRDRLRRLARDGRVSTGPWYSLPDSSAIHGEALVRNLMTGLRRARAFGGCMPIAYNVFSFGQISQLPQLYAGFGIDFIIFYKHMDRGRTRQPEFVWEGADGTRALATRLGAEARWNFFMMAHMPIVTGQDPAHKDWQYHWGTLGKTFHMAEPRNYADFHYVTEPEGGFDRERIREGFERTVRTLEGTAVPEHLLFWDGIDFTEANPELPAILDAAREMLGDRYVIVHDSLLDYVNAVRPLLETRDLDVAKGEMKDGPVGSVHTDVCSTHPRLKILNGRLENILYRQAEPLATLAWLEGADYPAAALDRVQHIMFRAQAHDSAHGVGPAGMIADLENRHRQGAVIAENTAREAMQNLCLRIRTRAGGEGEVFLCVFNPAPWIRTEIVTAVIDVPHIATVDRLYLETESGERVPVHVLDRRVERAGLYHPRGRNMPIYGERFEVLFEARDVPGLGYRTFTVAWDEKATYPYPHEGFEHVPQPAAPLATSPREAENEHLAVTLHGDGTFDLRHKATGRTYRNMNWFLDSGEAGNLQSHIPPAHNAELSSLGGRAEVSIEINSHLAAVFHVRLAMSVPCRMDPATGRRAAERVDLPIAYRLTLRRGSPLLEVECTVDNRARDHFLRVVFPTGIQAETVHAGGVFDALEFPVRHPADGDWTGPGLTRHQQHLFMDMHDGAAGLAVLNDTLRDFEVIDPDNGVVAQSLVRGLPLTIPVDNRLWMQYPGDDSAQSLGTISLRYALLPHAGGWEDAGIPRHAQAFATDLRLVQIGPQSGDRPPVFGGLEIDNPCIQFSCFKRAEDGESAVLRLFNPTARRETAVLTFERDVHAGLLSLNEECVDDGAWDGRRIELEFGPKKIVTVGLCTACPAPGA
jgi:mannosylglycerate hydrolase